MVKEWDRAPDINAALARPENAANRGSYGGDDVETFTLSDRLVYGPAVLAFIPGVYSGLCTDELCAMRDWHDDLADLDAQAFGVSADTPWSQLAFIEEYDLNFPLISGFNNDIIEEYGVRVDEGPLAGIASRSLFVIDEEQTVTYRWDAEPGELPDLADVKAALEAAR